MADLGSRPTHTDAGHINGYDPACEACNQPCQGSRPTQDTTPEKVYALFGDYLAICVNQCTCYGGEFGHERGCGYEPIARVPEIEAALGAVAEIRALHRKFHSGALVNGCLVPGCVSCGAPWPCPTIQILDRSVVSDG